MCTNTTSLWKYLSSASATTPPHHNLLYRPKKSKVVVRVPRLRLTCRRKRIRVMSREVRSSMAKTEMEVKNMKLYLENRSIIQENEKLRKRALLLHQENQALMTEFQKKFSHDHHLHLCH